MRLTYTQCKNAKPKLKQYKLYDSHGLYLLVKPNGSKCWRYKYRFGEKEKVLSLGLFPLVSLEEARLQRDKANKLLLDNIDPASAKRDEKKKAIYNANETFEVVALEWLELKSELWSKEYCDNIKRRLEKNLFPYCGKDPLNKIDPPFLLSVLKKVEARGAYDLAARCRQTCGEIFQYGIQTRRCSTNPARELKGALKTRPTEHFAAIGSGEIPELVFALNNFDYRIFPRTRRAILLSLLTFVRPGELRKARLTEFFLDKEQWIKPSVTMKKKREHIIPLSSQAIAIIKEQMQEIEHLNTEYLFPSRTSLQVPMSDGTVRIALQNLGFKGRMTAHGFRALARTAIREELDYAPDIIEVQLAHKPAGPLGSAYDRAQFLKQRTQMMQDWADYIDRVSVSNVRKIIRLKQAKDG